jgi:hypothetical protein
VGVVGQVPFTEELARRPSQMVSLPTGWLCWSR